jgi:hypothetical protein
MRPYFVMTSNPDDPAAAGRPIYDSVPFDILFQNPDGPP